MLCCGFFNFVGEGFDAVEMLIDSILSPRRWNEAKFDNIVLFAPKYEVSVPDVLVFMEKGGNVLVATDSDPSDSMRTLLSASGFDVETQKSKVVHLSSSIPDELIPGSTSPRNAFYAHNVIKNEYLQPDLGSDNLAIAYS